MDLEITLSDLEHVLEGNNITKNITYSLGFEALCEEHQIKISAGANVLNIDTYDGGEDREIPHETLRNVYINEYEERPDYTRTPKLWSDYTITTLITFFNEKKPNYIIKVELELYNVCRKATSIRLDISYR